MKLNFNLLGMLLGSFHLNFSHAHDPAALASCLEGIQSSGFAVLETDSYDFWFNESSVLELAETGTYKGPENIKEYVELLSSPFFDFYEQTQAASYFPVHVNEDECVIQFVSAAKFQVSHGFAEPACLESVSAYTLYYTLQPFNVRRINVFYPEATIQNLFGRFLNTNRVRNFICGILETNCPDTFQANALSIDSCKAMYDDLPSFESGSFLDGNSKGCRILHSAFAAHNTDHCSHLSFLPEEDPFGLVKCQHSKGVLPSDLFSDDELEAIQQFGVDKEFPAETLCKECGYDSTRSKTPSHLPTSGTKSTVMFGLSIATFSFLTIMSLLLSGLFC